MVENKPSDWKGKTRGGAFGYLFFIRLIKWLGIKPAYVFLCFVVIYFIPFAPKPTASTWRYCRKILKYGRWKSVRMLWLNYYRLGQVLIDKVAIGNGMVSKYHFEFDNYSRFLSVLNRQGGVVVLGAHVGNWEIGAPFFDDYGKRMNIVMYDAEYRKIKEILEKNAATKNYKVIPVNRDTITHVFEIEDALNKGEYVCFQGDRFVDAGRTLHSSFMGEEAAFPAGPFQVAARMGKDVIFYFTMREKGMCYRFHFVMAENPQQMKPREREKYLLSQYISALEKVVAKYPEQWFNYYDFWASGKS